jgi:hypothetical protein
MTQTGVAGVLGSASNLLFPAQGSHSRSYLGRNSVIFEELLVTRKLHGFALDDHEVNPFSRLFEQFRPARGFLVVPTCGIYGTIESLQCLDRIDHFSAGCEIGRSRLLLDFNRQRIIWIIQAHHSWSTLPRARGNSAYPGAKPTSDRFNSLLQESANLPGKANRTFVGAFVDGTVSDSSEADVHRGADSV